MKRAALCILHGAGPAHTTLFQALPRATESNRENRHREKLGNESDRKRMADEHSPNEYQHDRIPEDDFQNLLSSRALHESNLSIERLIVCKVC